jgi:hypothetical protein
LKDSEIFLSWKDSRSSSTVITYQSSTNLRLKNILPHSINCAEEFGTMRASSSDESEFVDDDASMNDEASVDDEASMDDGANSGGLLPCRVRGILIILCPDNASILRKRRSTRELKRFNKIKRTRFVELDPDMDPEPEDRVPRQRRSETWEMREEIMDEVEAEAISTQLPPFRIRESESWDPIVNAVEDYAREFNVCLRSRDSCLTTTHNGKVDE